MCAVNHNYEAVTLFVRFCDSNRPTGLLPNKNQSYLVDRVSFNAAYFNAYAQKVEIRFGFGADFHGPGDICHVFGLNVIWIHRNFSFDNSLRSTRYNPIHCSGVILPQLQFHSRYNPHTRVYPDSDNNNSCRQIHTRQASFCDVFHAFRGYPAFFDRCCAGACAYISYVSEFACAVLHHSGRCKQSGPHSIMDREGVEPSISRLSVERFNRLANDPHFNYDKPPI